jgi:hypothetical protein
VVTPQPLSLHSGSAHTRLQSNSAATQDAMQAQSGSAASTQQAKVGSVCVSCTKEQQQRAGTTPVRRTRDLAGTEHTRGPPLWVCAGDTKAQSNTPLGRLGRVTLQGGSRGTSTPTPTTTTTTAPCTPTWSLLCLSASNSNPPTHECPQAAPGRGGGACGHDAQHRRL